jgi:hypothetical protein
MRYLSGALVLATGALLLSACSAGYSIAGPDLATKVASVLQSQTGASTTPSIDCGTAKIAVKDGGQTMCTLTDGGQQYDVTVTFSNLNGGTFDFDAQVASTPR